MVATAKGSGNPVAMLVDRIDSAVEQLLLTKHISLVESIGSND
jgi:hypothetical protein